MWHMRSLLQHTSSRAPGLSSCGTWACGILVPSPGIKPVSPELAGGFLASEVPTVEFFRKIKRALGTPLSQNV